MKQAATLQLCSGLFDCWFMAGCMWGCLGSTAGALTESIGHIGGLWGWAACLLAPFGVVEMAIAWRARSDGGVKWVRWLATAQIASVSIGGITACATGIIALAMVRREA